MKRSVIRDRLIPDYASLHPGGRAATSFAVLLPIPPSCPRPLDRCPRALGPHAFSGLAGVAAIEAGAGWSWGLRGQDLGSSGGRSDGAQIVRRGLARLSISNNVESDLLSLVEPAHPSAFDRADMPEDILAAVIRLDEAEALLDIEPLHGSLRHLVFFQLRVSSGRAPAQPVRSSFGGKSSVRRGVARRGQVVRPKLDRSNVGYCGVDRKGVALIFWAAACLRDSDCDFCRPPGGYPR